MGLIAGAQSIDPHIDLPAKAIFTTRWPLPAASITPAGPGGQPGFAFALQELVGPSAIISNFTLYSSNPADPPINPVAPPVPTHDLPRLAPRLASVAGVAAPYMDLGGTWDFRPNASVGWAPITVPGEYTLQGFRVAAGTPVLYRRTFTLPGDWTPSLLVRLRADGCYSNCTVYVNGALVGAHLGGFTPFELDVTAALAAPGEINTLEITVVGSSLADTLSSASTYAVHDLGGISRKIGLAVVPPVNFANVHVITAFAPGSDYTAATLVLNISLANDGESQVVGAAVHAALAYGGVAEASGDVASPKLLPGGAVAYLALNLSVDAPPLWDPEHPRLHDLVLSLTLPGQPVATAALRVGFREVRIINTNRIAVNGHVIKARGTTRHEAHPQTGRSLGALEPAGGQWAKDIAVFRDANINYIRTSHYPPAEELMAAADELGMFIELEMPFCWADGNAGGAAFNYTVQAQREATVFNRNHASVIAWSLGNESPWTANFAASLADYLRELDGTRPYMFDGGRQQPIPPLDLLSVHYPPFSGPGEYANGSQPTLFGEYAHLNCYNRRELVTDPGVRDIWGLGVAHMWELIYASPGTLGACFWAGIDDIFAMPSGEPVGYGPWGVVDGWRRQKPETWIIRNFYAPVVLAVPAPGSDWAPTLTVANRMDFSDLAEVQFTWAIPELGVRGEGAAAGPPHTAGLTLTLAGLPGTLSGSIVINATSTRGVLLNAWQFPLEAPPAPPAPSPPPPPPVPTQLPDGRLRIDGGAGAGAFTWYVSPEGALTANTSAGGATPVLTGGPALMVLPINDDGGMQLVEGMPPILPFTSALGNWTAASVTHAVTSGALRVVVAGVYAGAATGAFTLDFDGAGGLVAAYNFTWTGATVAPRQVGTVWDLPSDLASLSWRRAAPWAAPYPADHIGRPAGNAVAPLAGPTLPPGAARNGSWALDPEPLGCADFRSTRHNITVFQLGAGARALAVIAPPPAQVHARAWVDGPGGALHMLTAFLSNEGGNPFSREQVLPQPKYSAGAVIAGASTLRLGAAL